MYVRQIYTAYQSGVWKRSEGVIWNTVRRPVWADRVLRDVNNTLQRTRVSVSIKLYSSFDQTAHSRVTGRAANAGWTTPRFRRTG